MTHTPIILFGGKGGVGKTTCSAAVAAWFAASGRRTIIMTSDMTPSLSDIFEKRIGDSVTTIAENLSAVEIGQDAIVARWKKKFSRDFSDILSQLIDLDALDNESRHQLLDYIGSAPSLREETMLDPIVDTVEAGNYDRVVWDTAPAGETLNLLNMPKFIRKHLRAGARVFEGLDKIGRRLTGARSISDTMDEWIALSERIALFIQSRSTFVLVANPEALVVRHAERLMETLQEYDLSIQGLVINRVMEKPDSPSMDSLFRSQQPYLADLKRLAGSLPVALLPYSFEEIKGVKTLCEAGELLSRQLDLC